MTYIYILYVCYILYIYIILTECKTIVILGIVRLDTFLYGSHSTYRTESEGLLDMYLNVVIG
jgi:hypothetical protein